MSLQDLVIVTGMSGSGKGTVLNAYEDLGFFCINNLPVPLVPRLMDAFHVSGGQVGRVALGIDIRAGERLRDFQKQLRGLRGAGFRLFVLFLEAEDEVLLRRFSETRRPHPLAVGRTLREAIRLERRRMHALRELADMTVDTSRSSPHEVKARVTERFRRRVQKSRLVLHILSFGFKHGVPQEADLVFDVRFLPNPHFIPHLRRRTGKDRSVARFLRTSTETGEYLKRLGKFLGYLIPRYTREGKSYLTVAIGCTGGRHRSVFVAEELGRTLRPARVVLAVRHRDVERPP
jgi:UPF0042 nucleotide-binding protein